MHFRKDQSHNANGTVSKTGKICFGFSDLMLVQIPKLCLKLFILTYEAYPQV